MLTAKWAAAGLVSVLLAAVAVAMMVAAATIGTLVIGEGFQLSGPILVDAVSASGRLVAGTIPYAALAMTLAVVTKSNTAGSAPGIGLSLIEPPLFALLGAVNDLFDKIAKAGLYYNTERVLEYRMEDSTVTAAQVLNSAAVLGVWMVGFVAISYVIFNRRDIVSG